MYSEIQEGCDIWNWESKPVSHYDNWVIHKVECVNKPYCIYLTWHFIINSHSLNGIPSNIATVKIWINKLEHAHLLQPRDHFIEWPLQNYSTNPVFRKVHLYWCHFIPHGNKVRVSSPAHYDQLSIPQVCFKLSQKWNLPSILKMFFVCSMQSWSNADRRKAGW